MFTKVREHKVMPSAGFTVKSSHFLHLSPDRAVSLFRQLLWAEAGRAGIGRHLINVPDCINVGDGGVDAYIDDAHPTDDDVIPEGSSVYQIKSSDLEPKACQRELHINGDLSKPLKDELVHRLEKGAAYILVLAADITDSKVRARRNAILGDLAKSGFDNAQIRVYTATQLAGFTNRHPSLVVSLRPELSASHPYETWGNSLNIKHPAVFVMESDRQALADQITTVLRDRSRCPVIRLTGLPGVGKTRLAYESLRADDLRHEVLYVRSAAELAGSLLIHTLVNDPNASAILVVDECDLSQHSLLSNTFAEVGPRFALITISFELGRVPMPTVSLHAEPLQMQTIEDILQQEYPGLPKPAAHRLAQFADGYPHIALLLADQYARDSSIDAYFSVPDDWLLNRLIGGSASTDSYQFRTTKNVLMGLSLFQRIGVSGIGEPEGRWLAERVGVTWTEFLEVLARERDRGTVQGEYYVFVTPFMLRIHLLEEWWRIRGFTDGNSLNEFVSSMPDNERLGLLRRFLEHFPYVAAVPRGASFVQELLAEGGVASNYNLLNSEIGGRLFLALTEALPEASLQTARRVIGNRRREDLLEFRDGRRAMVESLMRMAVWRELFQPAARLLLALGEAETESWSNNASGEFANLFSFGLGPAAPTEAPPSERLPILKEALSSASPERRTLGLLACQQALSAWPSHRAIGAEYQGVRQEPNLWQPVTYGELFDAYRATWTVTKELLSHFDGEDRARVVHVLLSSARGLSRLQAMDDMVVETLRELADDPGVDRRELIAKAVEILHYDSSRIHSETKLKWEQLASELSGDSFSSRMERYVAMDLLEDHFDEEGQQVDQAQPQIEMLASQAVEMPHLLTGEINWLVTKQARSGNRFGYALGNRDVERVFLLGVIDAQAAAGDDGDLSFLGGYLWAIAEQEPEKWESLLDGFASAPSQAQWVVELTWRSGRLTERASSRVLRAIRAGITSPDSLRFFRYGPLVRSLTAEAFSDWMDVLLDADGLSAVSTALDLLVMYGGYNQSTEPARKVVFHPAWFRPADGGRHPSHDSFWWAHIAEALCNDHPDVALELAQLMLAHIGETGTIVEWLSEEPSQVLNIATRQRPWEVWQIASSMLGPPIDRRAFLVGHWLKGSDVFGSGGSHILQDVPQPLIWAWVEACPETRLLRLTEFVPRLMCGPKDDSCLARELLVRYGHDSSVRSLLRANFSSEGWIGLQTQHLLRKKSWLLDLHSQETDANVLLWINEYLGEIEVDINWARQREERDGW